MQHAEYSERAALVVDGDEQRSAFVLRTSDGPLVVSYERTAGAMVGTHEVVDSALLPSVSQRLAEVASEWGAR